VLQRHAFHGQPNRFLSCVCSAQCPSSLCIVSCLSVRVGGGKGDKNKKNVKIYFVAVTGFLC
jgi:hypothetical protein